jgi:hypothetical protein
MAKYNWEKIESGDMTPMWNGKVNEKFVLSVNDEIIGKYLETKENVGPNKSKVYYLVAEDGSEIGVWGGTVLDTRLKSIKAGEMVKIVYLGEKEGKTGRVYQNYDVFHSPEGDLPEVEDGEASSLLEDETINPEDIPF